MVTIHKVSDFFFDTYLKSVMRIIMISVKTLF